MANNVRVSFVGDNVAIDHPEGLSSFYAYVKDHLAEADLRFGNVEWPMTDIEGYDPTRYGRSLRRMAPKEAQGLIDAGFDVVSLANNHMMDWGPGGLLQTLSVIDETGIARCGAGQTAEAALVPAILERNGLRIGFLAYTAVFVYPQYPARPSSDQPQLATLDVATSYAPHRRLVDMPGTPARTRTEADTEQLQQICDAIRKLRSQVDHVVVSWHWGVSWGVRGSSQYHPERADYQEEVGRACIDAGASVIVGHHPHILQGIEVYRGCPIFYSLGNFVFWYPPKLKPHHDRRSGSAWVTLGQEGVEAVSFKTAMIDDDDLRPRFVAGEAGARVADLILASSVDLQTSLTYDKTTGTIEVGL